jgi:hypothetical protein
MQLCLPCNFFRPHTLVEFLSMYYERCVEAIPDQTKNFLETIYCQELNLYSNYQVSSRQLLNQPIGKDMTEQWLHVWNGTTNCGAYLHSIQWLLRTLHYTSSNAMIRQFSSMGQEIPKILKRKSIECEQSFGRLILQPNKQLMTDGDQILWLKQYCIISPHNTMYF